MTWLRNGKKQAKLNTPGWLNCVCVAVWCTFVPHKLTEGLDRLLRVTGSEACGRWLLQAQGRQRWFPVSRGGYVCAHVAGVCAHPQVTNTHLNSRLHCSCLRAAWHRHPLTTLTQTHSPQQHTNRPKLPPLPQAAAGVGRRACDPGAAKCDRVGP